MQGPPLARRTQHRTGLSPPLGALDVTVRDLAAVHELCDSRALAQSAAVIRDFRTHLMGPWVSGSGAVTWGFYPGPGSCRCK